MKLTKIHRENLITKLGLVTEEIEVNKAVQDSFFISDKNKDMAAHTDIDLFLLYQRKLLIVTSLINNEIDF